MDKLFETQKPLHPLLQAKLQLLQSIQKGDYKRIAQLSYALSKIGKTNQDMYSKLSTFVQQHKNQLKQMKEQDVDEQAQIIDIQGDFVQGQEWNSDDQISYEDSQSDNEDQNNNQNKQKQFMKIGKEVLKQNKPVSNAKELFKDRTNNCQRRSISKNKNFQKENNTYQFKKQAVGQKKVQDSKKTITQVHRNSAISKVKNLKSN